MATSYKPHPEMTTVQQMLKDDPTEGQSAAGGA
jgi:hypothetical protein